MTEINVFICLLIALRITLFSKRGRRHRPVISFIAAISAVAFGCVPVLYVYGFYKCMGIPVLIVNLIICARVFYVRGNVARIFTFGKKEAWN